MNSYHNIKQKIKQKNIKIGLYLLLFVFCFLGLISSVIIISIYSLKIVAVNLNSNQQIILISFALLVVSISGIVIVSLFDFIFNTQIKDDTIMKKINQKTQPELYILIKEVAQQLNCKIPKNIYITYDTSASINYKTGLFRLLSPPKPHLRIGIILIQTLTSNELKAVIAHELAHILNINYFHKVHNLLSSIVTYQNLTPQEIKHINDRTSNVIILIGNFIAERISKMFKQLLFHIFFKINENYIPILQYFEFKSDESAAQAFGSDFMKSTLLKLEFIEVVFNNSMETVLEIISNNETGPSIYDTYRILLPELAKINQIEIIRSTPIVSRIQNKRLKTGNITLVDLFSSHPTIEERIKYIESLNTQSKTLLENYKATTIQKQSELENEFNTCIFPKHKNNSLKTISNNELKDQIASKISSTILPEIFNGYYNHYLPLNLNIEALDYSEIKALTNPYSEENLDLIFSFQDFEADIRVLQSIQTGNYKIKSFYYLGRNIKVKNIQVLIDELQNNKTKIDQKIKILDENIYKYFKHLENSTSQNSKLSYYYRTIKIYSKLAIENEQFVKELSQKLEFLNYGVSINKIEPIFNNLHSDFLILKSKISHLISTEKILYKNLSKTDIEKIELFIKNDLIFVKNGNYDHENIQILLFCLEQLLILSNELIHLNKYQFLNYKASLIS